MNIIGIVVYIPSFFSVGPFTPHKCNRPATGLRRLRVTLSLRVFSTSPPQKVRNKYYMVETKVFCALCAHTDVRWASV